MAERIIFPVLKSYKMATKNREQLIAEIAHIERDLQANFNAFNSTDFSGSILVTGTYNGKKFNEIFKVSANDPGIKDFFEQRGQQLYAKKVLLQNELAGIGETESTFVDLPPIVESVS